VLHLDPADAYGGAFGAFAESPGGVGWDVPSSADLERRAAMRDGLASDENFFADENVEHAELRFPALGAPVDARARLGATTYCSPATPSGSIRRQFCLDRSGPRLALGADNFVDLLVRSGAHKYVEFKALDATNIYKRDGEFAAVPASRAEVFRDKTLSLAEKRALMRVLKHVVRVAEREGTVVGAGDPDAADAAVGAPGSEWRAAASEDSSVEPLSSDSLSPLYEREDELFSTALERLGLGQNTSASLAVQFALALSGDENETARDGFASLTAYLASLHRFGRDVGAALVPLYGTGEFPQAFARLAAVHGATYALRVGVRGVAFSPAGDKQKSGGESIATAVTAGGQRLSCRALAAGDAAFAAAAATRWVSRMTAVVDGACVPEKNKSGETTMLVFPPGSVRGAPAGAATRVAQMSAATGACPLRAHLEKNAFPYPAEYRVLQASVASRDPARSAEDDLRGVLELLADTGSLRGYDAGTKDPEEKSRTDDEAESVTKKPRPRAVWVSFHREVAPENVRGFVNSWASLPRNVVTCPGPDQRADFADLVAVAEAAHARLWGEDGNGLFPAAKKTSDAEEEDALEGASRRRGTRREDSDEDEMDALLRDLPGGIGA
jgi:RAB protein geranylgeranyltransferase component A